MPKSNRRSFLRLAGAVAAGASAVKTSTAGDANERLVAGVIGCGGRGIQLRGKNSSGSNRMRLSPTSVIRIETEPGVPKEATNADHAVGDMRRIFDDKSVDAVVIASCDHWHAPAAILACEAGKHVYVEKPCSHNLREGRMMIDAARKHDVVMQHGTQSRSNQSRQTAVAMLREGTIGEVLVAKHVNSQKRGNIGHHKPSKPPDHLDYDLWVGPAEWREYQSNFVHYNWHWIYSFGTGDIGNDGVHGIDVARWGLGVKTHPGFVTGYGSKLFFDDDQEFPDTYAVTFEYPGEGKVGQKRLLIYEQRIWSPYREDAEGNSTFFYGTEGMLVTGRKIQVFGPNNKLLCQEELSAGDSHQRDFLDAVKDRTRRPNAEIQIGHLSASLCHLGNIVARTGRAIRFDPKTEQILGDEEAARLLGRKYRQGHWAVPKAS